MLGVLGTLGSLGTWQSPRQPHFNVICGVESRRYAHSHSQHGLCLGSTPRLPPLLKHGHTNGKTTHCVG